MAIWFWCLKRTGYDNLSLLFSETVSFTGQTSNCDCDCFSSISFSHHLLEAILCVSYSVIIMVWVKEMRIIPSIWQFSHNTQWFVCSMCFYWIFPDERCTKKKKKKMLVLRNSCLFHSDSLCVWALDWVSACNMENRSICITMWAFEMPVPAAFQRKLAPAVEWMP